MPRFARTPFPGAVHHIISRFTNRTHRFTTQLERTEYLDRLGLALKHTDWQLLGYALMSNHVHLIALAGSLPSSALMRPLHGGFAGWLNRQQRTLGPVFADRHRLLAAPTRDALRLLAYVHNNPVRARLCLDAAQSSWTSHRAYLGQQEAPDWLRVDEGLALCGLAPSEEGRGAFDAQVRLLAAQDEPDADGAGLDELRAGLRRAVGPVEIGTPYQDSAGLRQCGLYAPEGAALHPRWEGAVVDVLERVAVRCGLELTELRSRDRSRRLVRARRLALLVHTRHLHRPQIEMAAALGISNSSASELVHRRLSEEVAREMQQAATEIAAACREAAQ